MSDVASPELSQELYELSGWETRLGREAGIMRYDLGYLLRKLPVECFVFKHKDHYGAYRPYIKDAFKQVREIKAATPEDAVAILAIELFKKGVLTK